MVKPPRSVGRPLDPEAARVRAAQAAALADPMRLRVLSAVATAAGGQLSDARIAEALDLDEAVVASTADELAKAGLLSGTPNGRHPTADALVRFGRLVTGQTTAPAIRGASGSPSELSPVARRIADDLSYRFSSVFSPETVRKYVADSYQLLAERAKVTTFLPSLTARFATDRLSALATAQGLVLHGTPEVLFVCVENAGRSQMASAILRHLAGDQVHVRTAGSAPASVVHPAIVESLDEIGVPIAAEFPKPLTDEVVMAADYVITMGCGDACPIYPGRRYMDWAIDDPVGLPKQEIARIRDEVYQRVVALLDELVPPTR